MKKISYFIIFLIIVGCGFEPIYSKKNPKNLTIDNYILEGDKNINRKLISLLNFEKNSDQRLSPNDLILNSKKITSTSAKDKLGNPSIYKTTISVNLILKNSNNKIVKSRNFSESFSYNSMINKFDLMQYQKGIEADLITRLVEEITIFINY
jgi:hypothetical protein